MSTEIRWAKPADAAALALVLGEMALHYRQAPLDEAATLTTVRSWLSAESPAYPHFALAWREGTVAGLASVAVAHPGVDLRRLLFLKELFVRDGFRCAGVGLSLLRFLAGFCAEQGLGRIDLTTEDWNEGAIRFYRRLGAERHEQKVFLRFDSDRLRSLSGATDAEGD